MTSKRRLRVEALAATAFWLFVTAMYVAQTWWLISRERMPTRLGPALVWSGGFYLWWAPLSVAVWRLTRGWLPAAIGWPVFLLRHAGLAVAAAIAHSLLVIGSAKLLLPVENEPFVQMLIGQLRGRSYTELIIYAGVVACGQAVWYYERWRERETQAARLEAQLAAAQLNVLQAQVHPHFLFNSLHAIASLARDGRNAEVVKLVADLSDLLRRVMDPQQPTLPLATELDLARRYLDIQQVRFSDRLCVDIDVPPDARGVEVPALSLQPLVDNAVRHGVTPSVRGGTVRVHARVDAGLLHVRVDDDGAGPAAGWSLAETTGTGLANLRARLDILYNGRASLTAGAGAQGGFSVVMTVPVSR